MKLEESVIPGVFEAAGERRCDHRGAFTRLFCADELAIAHKQRQILQINLSLTCTVGAVRGLHFQYPPYAEAKWVRCLRGRVFDVCVDLRRGSPTFLRWHATILDHRELNAFLIPEGCAHGFQVLEADSELLYLHTAYYAPAAEGGVRWDDPRVAVQWPLPVSDISQRDQAHPLLGPSFEGIVV